MNITLRIWRQTNAAQPGRFERHALTDVSADSAGDNVIDVIHIAVGYMILLMNIEMDMIHTRVIQSSLFSLD